MTETGHYFVFSVAELSAQWFTSLPSDLQHILGTDAADDDQAIVPWRLDFIAAQRKEWVAHDGELINLPPDEPQEMVDLLQ